VRHIALTVRFHPACRPAAVFRARWARIEDTEPTEAEAVELVGGQTSMELVPDGDCVVGWRWRW
jgi:hypothetical protein